MYKFYFYIFIILYFYYESELLVTIMSILSPFNMYFFYKIHVRHYYELWHLSYIDISKINNHIPRHEKYY